MRCSWQVVCHDWWDKRIDYTEQIDSFIALVNNELPTLLVLNLCACGRACCIFHLLFFFLPISFVCHEKFSVFILRIEVPKKANTTYYFSRTTSIIDFDSRNKQWKHTPLFHFSHSLFFVFLYLFFVTPYFNTDHFTQIEWKQRNNWIFFQLNYYQQTERIEIPCIFNVISTCINNIIFVLVEIQRKKRNAGNPSHSLWYLVWFKAITLHQKLGTV